MTESPANDLKNFKLALDNISDQVIITDPEGTVVYANSAVEKITGYKPEDVVGKKSGALWKSPMSADYYKDFWHTIKEKKETFIGEIQNKRKNGELYTASITVSPVLDDRGKILFFVGIERDVTKEREIEKAKDEFISLASHQLRTPLTSISWYTEMLLAGDVGKLNPKQNIYFKKILSSSLRMNDIIKSFLNILRLETGRVTNNPVPTDLADVIKSILNEQELEIEKKQLKIVQQYQESLPLPIIDTEIVHVILQNLISNAIKYTFDGKEVLISLNYVTDKDSILVSVSGADFCISANERDKIFTKFYRTDNARKSDPSGNGIGLYMTKKMVDIIGGTVWFASEEGIGTTFYVLIPIEPKS